MDGAALACGSRLNGESVVTALLVWWWGGRMRQVGFLLQLFVLAILPMLCYWQLQFGFRLIWMPALLTVGIVLFALGTKLRGA